MSDYQSPDKNSGLSRRDFLKLLFGGSITGLLLYLIKGPLFWEKTGRSIASGKVLEDIGEALASQIPKEETLSLGERDKYDDLWLEKFSPERHFFKIAGDEHKRIAFLEITNKCTVKTTQSMTTDIGSAFVDNSKEFLTLPTPQIATNNKYTMFAVFNDSGQVVRGSNLEKSPVRGGIIFQGGKVQIGIPETNSYAQFNQSEPNSAQIEYFCVLDSNGLRDGIEGLSKIQSLSGIKNFRNDAALSSAIVTFSKRNGDFKTFVMSSYRDLDIPQKKFSPEYLDDFTIPQLASLATNFLTQQLKEYDHFTIAFPDPGPYQGLAHSQGLTSKQIADQQLQPFITRAIATDNETIFHRVLGGNASVSSVYRPVLSDKPAYLVVQG